MDETTPTPGTEEPKKGMSAVLAIVIIIVIVLIVGGAIWYWYSKTAVKDTANMDIPEKTTSASASASPSASGTDETVGWKTYSNSTYGFSINYPSDLTYTESSLEEGGVAFAVRFNQNNAKKTNVVNIWVKSNYTLAEEISSAQQGQGEYNISNKTIAGVQGKLLDSTKVNIRDYAVEKNNKLYILESNQTNKNILDQMISTLKFL